MRFDELRNSIGRGGITAFASWDSNSRDPVGALALPVQWGPAIVPVDYQADWDASATRASFRDDAELLVDLLAITHGTAVRSALYGSHADDEQLDRLLGYGSLWPNDPESALQLADRPAALQEAMDDAAEFFDAIGHYKGNHDLLRLAISRMAASQGRSGPNELADGILDVAIALEIMYGPLETELQYKLATRAAYFLGGDREDRAQIYEATKALYRARSDIVHGRTNKTNRETLTSGFDIARRTLRKLICIKRPPTKPQEWDRVILGTEGGPAKPELSV